MSKNAKDSEKEAIRELTEDEVNEMSQDLEDFEAELEEKKNPEFKFVMEQGNDLINVFESAEKITDVCNLLISEKGLRITEMDAGRNALIDIFISKDDFDEFETNSEIKIGINLIDLIKMLRRCKNSTITLQTTKKSNIDKKLILKSKSNSEKKKRTKTWKLIMIEVKDSGSNLDKINSTYKVDSSNFIIDLDFIKESIIDCGLIGERIDLKLNSDELMINADGVNGSIESIFEKGDMNEFNFDSDVINYYSIDYFKRMFNTIKSDLVKISLRQDCPIRAEFNLFNESRVQYFLGCLVDQEEEDYDESY